MKIDKEDIIKESYLRLIGYETNLKLLASMCDELRKDIRSFRENWIAENISIDCIKEQSDK